MCIVVRYRFFFKDDETIQWLQWTYKTCKKYDYKVDIIENHQEGSLGRGRGVK